MGGVANYSGRMLFRRAQLWAPGRRLVDVVEAVEMRWLRELTYSPRAVPEEWLAYHRFGAFVPCRRARCTTQAVFWRGSALTWGT